MKKFLIITIILLPLTLSAQNAENTEDKYSYQKNPIFVSLKAGYRYPTGKVSTFDDGINYEETSSKNIYKPGFAYGFNSGIIIFPFLFGIGMEGGDLPLTSKGQQLANQRRPEWSKVKVEYASFEFFIGTYLFSYEYLSCYTTISLGDLAVNFYNGGENPDNRNYTGSAVSLGFQIKPSEDKTWYLLINGRYQFYVSKPVIPHDLTIFFGFGMNLTFSDACNCIGILFASQ